MINSSALKKLMSKVSGNSSVYEVTTDTGVKLNHGLWGSDIKTGAESQALCGVNQLEPIFFHFLVSDLSA